MVVTRSSERFLPAHFWSAHFSMATWTVSVVRDLLGRVTAYAVENCDAKGAATVQGCIRRRAALSFAR
jgi:hypothetical protein